MTDRVIRIVVDDSAARPGIDRTRVGLETIDNTSKKAQGSLSNIPGILKAIAAGLSIRQVIAYADAWSQTESQLRLVTETSAELSSVQQDLLDLANSTGAAYESTVGLFTKLTRATEALRLSEERRLRITETVNKAVTISGASAEEGARALTQLSQALSGGVLRAEEFNSIAEQTPRVLQLIADGIGVPIGQLRALSAAGEITSEVLVGALEKGAAQIDKEFLSVEVTVARVGVVLKNQLLGLVGLFDETSGASKGLTSAILAGVEQIDDFGRAVTGTLKPGEELSDTVAKLAQATIGAEVALRATAEGLRIGLSTAFSVVGDSVGAVVFAINSLNDIDVANIGDVFVDLLRASRPLSALGDSIGQVAAAIAQLLQGNFQGAFDVITDVDATGFVRRQEEAIERLDQNLAELQESAGVKAAADALAGIGTNAAETLREANSEVMAILQTIETGAARISEVTQNVAGSVTAPAGAQLDAVGIVDEGRNVTERDVLAAIDSGRLSGRREFGAAFGAPAVQGAAAPAAGGGQVVEITFGASGESFRVLAPDADAARLGSALEEEARRAGGR